MHELELELKKLIIESLNLEDTTPDDIAADTALFGDDLGLDSIDALELGIAIKRHFNVLLDGNDTKSREHFYSVATLAAFIESSKK